MQSVFYETNHPDFIPGLLHAYKTIAFLTKIEYTRDSWIYPDKSLNLM